MGGSIASLGSSAAPPPDSGASESQFDADGAAAAIDAELSSLETGGESEASGDDAGDEHVEPQGAADAAEDANEGEQEGEESGKAEQGKPGLNDDQWAKVLNALNPQPNEQAKQGEQGAQGKQGEPAEPDDAFIDEYFGEESSPKARKAIESLADKRVSQALAKIQPHIQQLHVQSQIRDAQDEIDALAGDNTYSAMFGASTRGANPAQRAARAQVIETALKLAPSVIAAKKDATNADIIASAITLLQRGGKLSLEPKQGEKSTRRNVVRPTLAARHKPQGSTAPKKANNFRDQADAEIEAELEKLQRGR